MRHLFYYTLFFTLNFAQNDFNWQTNGVPIRQGLHIEWQRTGDTSPDGSIIFAWSDCRNNGVRDIIAQKVDVDGNNQWGDHGLVVVSATGRQEDPQLVTDGYGGAYIIWMDYRDETDAEGDIYAQYIHPSGVLTWPLPIPLTNQAGQQFSPNICSDGQHGAYVIWKNNATSSYGDIYATHLSDGGAIASGQGVPIITYTSYRSSPSLNMGGSGEAVLVWSDDRNTDEDLYAQRISVSGNTINKEWGNGGKLICDASGDQTSPRVVQYNGEETIITWEDMRNGNTDAYYQILDGNGNGQLTSDGESACLGDWDIIKPRVKAENSVAYIVWEDRRNGWTSDIYAQKIKSNGSTDWNNGMVITTSDGSQTEPRLTTDGNGGVYFVWEDQRNSDETGIDIYAQHVNSNGSITHGNNGELICDAENKQFNPLVRNDGSGGAIIVWGDQRFGGSYGMFVQRLQSQGISFSANGIESFFGIGTDASNEPYKHGSVYLDNDQSLVYWQDNRWGDSKIYGTLISTAYDGFCCSGNDYFDHPGLNGQQLSELAYPQENPKAILVENKIFLSFKVEESPNENVYLQLLNMDLSLNGNAIELANSSTSKQGFDMVFGNDANIYYAYSEDYDITLKKISSSTGNVLWSISAVTNTTDDIIRSIYPYPGSGCIIIYESSGFVEGSHIYALAVDGNGQPQSGWPIMISDLSEDQYYESSTLTDNGIFISFSDNTSGNYDVYGQYVLFNGSLHFDSSGESIASGTGDQQSSSVAYNEGQEVFVCYESPDGSETDIRCNEVDLNSQTVYGGIAIAAYDNNQNTPFVYWSGHSFMISWEDSRLSSNNSLEEDIFFQEYKEGDIILQSGGTELSLFDKRQEHTINSKYSDTDNSYIIVFEDHRSTGKAQITNLWAQSYTSTHCPALGDINSDGGWNVLDIVTLANCVLAGSIDPDNNCFALENACAGDMNGDGAYNVLDIVALANCVLAGTCGGRVDDATESHLIMNGNIVSIEADGFIGGVQITLQHGDDFTIEMTDRALFADYLTNGNETCLLVITPETDDLFRYSGDFEITEIIVANSYEEIPASLPLAASFSISNAYPNPFNPTTTMDLFMPVAGDMQVEVYNLLGQVVATLGSGYMDMGTYTLTWDATDVSSGTYFVKAQTDGFTKTQKLMLVK